MPTEPKTPESDPNVCQNDTVPISSVKKSNTIPHTDVKESNTSLSNNHTPKKTKEERELLALQRVMRRKKLSPFPHISHARKRAYATAMAITGMHGKACELAGVHEKTPRTPQWREDQELQDAVRAAKLMSADLIEDALYDRAVNGVTKQYGWYKGESGGTYQEFDTTAAIFLLKGLRPDKYAERHEVRGVWANIDLKSLPDAIISRLGSGENPDAVLSSWVAELQAKGEEPPAGLITPSA